jgi:hypothetical protein
MKVFFEFGSCPLGELMMIESGSHEARKLIRPKILFLVSWVPD